MTHDDVPTLEYRPHPARYAVSLRRMLDYGSLRGARVLAGERGIDALVAGVSVIESPDVSNWTKPHDLLVTTGFPFVVGSERHPAVSLLELVPQLHTNGLAGIGIKLERWLHAVPADVLAIADELGFPILALPADIGFETIIREVYEQVTRAETEAFSRIDSLNTRLGNLVLGGADLDRIADEVARELHVGVVVTSNDGREQAAALTEPLRELLAAADLIDPSGRLRVERLKLAPTSIGAGDGEIRAIRVQAAGADLARLVCVSPDQPIGDPDLQALERIAMVVALLFTRRQAVDAVANKYRGDFLRDVLLGRVDDDDFVVGHADTFGWDLRRPLVVISAQLDSGQYEATRITAEGDGAAAAGVETRRRWQARFAAAWRQVCDSADRSIATADFSTEVVVLVPVPAAGDAPGALRALVGRLIDRVGGDRGGGRRPFSVGVSRIVAAPDGLPVGYDQARRALQVGRRFHGECSTTWFDDLGVHRLLATIPDHAELGRYAQDVLGELAADSKEAAELRGTLQILLDSNVNVAEAARLQFVHYNTMRYRLTKLTRILGPFTTDPTLRLNVALALQVRDTYRPRR